MAEWNTGSNQTATNRTPPEWRSVAFAFTVSDARLLADACQWMASLHLGDADRQQRMLRLRQDMQAAIAYRDPDAQGQEPLEDWLFDLEWPLTLERAGWLVASLRVVAREAQLQAAEMALRAHTAEAEYARLTRETTRQNREEPTR